MVSFVLEVASAMGGEAYPEDSLLVAISGRYEYSNKGIDVFLDALGRIDAGQYAGRRILAFVMVPSGNNGPDKELVAKLGGN
jgi:phosphorylase/glycogen(starch) synthase